MIFKKKIKELRQAREKNRLVIFVGAGVSKNSGIPSWNELVRCFASKLHHGKCKKCKHYKLNCYTDEGCKVRYNFCQDEYLKIPQYFFNSEGKDDYMGIIRKVLNVKAKSNPIHELIMDLYPKHIITTNFDKLIENTKRPNSMMYKVIIKDEELLTYQVNNNYIIKMHGDIDNPETIVLKENDYLRYHQDHILIETFIKSLLIDHTFLFIGYSLSDYNLKLIVSWIENLAKGADVKEKRSRNYILQPNIDNIEKYIEKYFLENNLLLIKTSDLPMKIKKKHSNINLDTEGRVTYILLDYILDSNNDFLVEPLVDILYDRYQIFRNQNRVSFEDLISVYPFKSVDHIGNILFFHDESKFKLLKEILLSTNKKTNYIKAIINKAGIEAIQCGQDSQPVNDLTKNKNISSELIKLEQSNNYMEVLSKADDISNRMVKAYYLYVINPYSKELMSYMENIERSLANSRDYFKLLLFNYNMSCINQIQWKKAIKEIQDFKTIFRNIPKPYRDAYLYFEKIFEGNFENINKCVRLADKCEAIYTKKTNTIHLGIQDYDLFKLQAIAYDYYFYYKMNNLMLDHFTDPKIFLEPYVRTILCTYSPKKERELNILGFELMPLKEYKLNSTDFDILIKYTNLKKLKLFISDFNVKELNFEEDIKIEEKFVNLCNSINLFPNRYLLAYLNNFLYIITKCQTSNPRLSIIVNSIYELLFKKSEARENILSDIFDELINFLRYFKNENISGFTNILNGFLDSDIINYSKKQHLMLDRAYKLLITYSNEEIQEKVSELIDNTEKADEKIKMIYDLHVLFNDYQKSEYMAIVEKNLKLVDTYCLFDYLKDKYLEYNKEIEERFYGTLQKEVEKRKAKPNERTITDWLAVTVDHLIILFLLNRIKTLEKFKCFAEYSEQLTFLLNPENFDYSKIKTENYMWMNFLRNKEYIEIFKEHSSEIVKNLKKSVENGYATEPQKIMLYRYFLTDEEVSDYL